jgi:signal peptidase II
MKKYILPASLIALVISIDQWLKFWVKANMDYPENFFIKNLPSQIDMAGNWFKLHFIENNGMAFGMELAGGETGKIILTSFRILAVIAGFWYLLREINKNSHRGLIVCVSLIIAGALGNIVDSVFYGVWFTDINNYEGGYFHGQVVDMLYFPIVQSHFPSWFPKWGGEEFTFFSPIFNLADASISIGVIALVLFQNRFYPKPESTLAAEEFPLHIEGDESNPSVSDSTSEHI